MFKFFRKNIQAIGWVIVLTFALTMFGGSLFINSGAKQAPQQQANFNDFAAVGDINLSYNRYIQVVSNLAQLSNPNNNPFSPNELEYLQSQAFFNVVSETVLYNGAINEGLALEKEEFKKGFLEFLYENDLKDKAALKKLLKERDFKYSVFEESLKKQLLVKKFQNVMTSDINFDSSILPVAFSQVDFQMIKINENTTITNEDESDLEGSSVAEKANKVYEMLEDGLDFDQAFKSYSSTKLSQDNGVYRQISFGILPEKIEKEVFNLSVGNITKPIQLNKDYYILKLLGKNNVDYPEGFDETQYLASLNNAFKERRLKEFRERFLIYNPLVVNDKNLKPIVLKQEGDYFGAITAYKKLSSEAINSPVPHYFIAEIYMLLGQVDNALTELAKADLKAKVAAETDFAELHFFYAQVLLDQGDKDRAVEQYDKLFYLIENDIDALNQLKNIYSELNLSGKSKEISDHIAQLEALNEAALEDDVYNNSSLEEESEEIN